MYKYGESDNTIYSDNLAESDSFDGGDLLVPVATIGIGGMIFLTCWYGGFEFTMALIGGAFMALVFLAAAAVGRERIP